MRGCSCYEMDSLGRKINLSPCPWRHLLVFLVDKGNCELMITGCDRCVVGEEKMILVVLDKGI